METTENRFVQYYEKQSLNEATLIRSRSIMSKIVALRQKLGLSDENLDVTDIGCNAGTQSMVWAEAGHKVSGIDIIEELIDLAKKRASEHSLPIRFEVGSATSIPLQDESSDVCIMPELLEHVPEWELCLEEATRILRPNGILYLSTSNVLCPKQEEFDLPLYSWYPSLIKRRLEKLSVTSKRHWVSYTEYPAVNWFSYYQLSKYLKNNGFTCRGRFEMIIESSDGGTKVNFAKLINSNFLFRFVGHVLTPYTVVFAVKNA